MVHVHRQFAIHFVEIASKRLSELVKIDLKGKARYYVVRVMSDGDSKL